MIFSIFITLIVSAVAANRYLFTPIGLDSVGRQWQNYVNYFDFGFLRRAFLGTVNSFFIPDEVVDKTIDHRVVSWIIHNIYSIIYAIAFLLITLRSLVNSSGYTKSVIILSPFFLMHYAYTSGNHDAALSLIAAACVLQINRLPIVFLLCTIGMLVHESFLFAYIPVICAILLYHSKSFTPPMALAGFSAIFFLGLVLYSKAFFDVEHFETTLATIAPELTRTGAWELSGGIRDNLAFTFESLDAAFRDEFTIVIWSLVLVVLGLLYIFLVPLWWGHYGFFFALGALLPTVALLPIATDIYRWFAYSAFAIFLIHLYLSRHGLVCGALSEKRPKLFWLLFGPLFLLGPLGSSCYEACGKASFPLFFAVIDKFFTLTQFSRLY